MAPAAKLDIQTAPYGRLPDGRTARLFTLTNSAGLRARLTDFGAITVSVETPDRDGRLADITAGFDTLDHWVHHNSPYFGATIGRVANRIALGRCSLDGRPLQLSVNHGRHHLHGGTRGFSRVLWSAEPVRGPDRVGIRFTYRSPDGEEGYPGHLDVTAIHALTESNAFVVDFTATTDAPTFVNLAYHTYWNLGGDGSGDILGHELWLAADRYTVTDAELIPTGEIRPTAGTPLDFTRPTPIGARIGQLAGGYDHNFVITTPPGTLRPAARVRDPRSGRTLELLTDQPGVQLYTANFLDGALRGKGGRALGRHAGLCLETQCFPDAPNHAEFPSIVLRPGQTYRHTMVHRFGVE